MHGDTGPWMKTVWTGMGQLGEAGTMKTTKARVTESMCQGGGTASGRTTPQPPDPVPARPHTAQGAWQMPRWFTRAQGLHRGPREGQTRGGGEAG